MSASKMSRRDVGVKTRGTCKGPDDAVSPAYMQVGCAFETGTALQERLVELQEQYAGDLVIEVWGREIIRSSSQAWPTRPLARGCRTELARRPYGRLDRRSR
jgi:hypothetical protein